MSFYTYDQNNSGGTFDFDADAGISAYVIVEADSMADADDRAERIGIYFDGVDADRDCDRYDLCPTCSNEFVKWMKATRT